MIPRNISQPFYKSPAWKRCRKAYIDSVGGLCERCLKENKIVKGYIVHHREHLTEDTINDPKVSLSWSNLEYLCHDCHNKEHFQKENKYITFQEKNHSIEIHNNEDYEEHQTWYEGKCKDINTFRYICKLLEI